MQKLSSLRNAMCCVLCVLFAGGAFCAWAAAEDSTTPRHQGLTATEWRDVFLGKRKLEVSYFEVFEKVRPLSTQSLAVFAELLNDNEMSNHVVYVLNTIAAACDENASKLVPNIQRSLVDKNICKQLAALCALRSVGPAAQSATNAVEACLRSEYPVVRVNAAKTLSAFGECSKKYLQTIEKLCATETNDSFRVGYQQAIKNIKMVP